MAASGRFLPFVKDNNRQTCYPELNPRYLVHNRIIFLLHPPLNDDSPQSFGNTSTRTILRRNRLDEVLCRHPLASPLNNHPHRFTTKAQPVFIFTDPDTQLRCFTAGMVQPDQAGKTGTHQFPDREHNVAAIRYRRQPLLPDLRVSFSEAGGSQDM